MLGIDKVLVIYCDYGRLGNRLHTHANALAWCIENNYNLINLSFSDYAELFKSSSKHKCGNLQQTKSFLFKSLSSTLFRNFLKRLLLSDKWLERLAWIVKQIRPVDEEVLRETDLNRQINHNKINLVRYWDISCTSSLQTHQSKIRHYLLPSKRFVVSAEKAIFNLGTKYECIVGVHARRGDYINYLGGIHYHSWESYLQWANQTKLILEKKGKKNVGIVICSDELPPASIQKMKSIHFSLSKEFMVDIHLLSLCNYNLGPPSSFGTWVSWFGKIPRLVLHNNTEITSLEQFGVSSTC
jgi:hypothetical protein